MKINSNNQLTKNILFAGVFVVTSVLLVFCKAKDKPNSIEIITDGGRQSSTFNKLVQLVNITIPEQLQKDTVAFLILPVQASCPACRNKTIDSLVQHKENLPNNHFVIISANGGRKTINGYFLENEKEMPQINTLFLDSTNLAYKLQLYENKPTIYYASNQKVYKKVAAIPQTVREDLREFFSGHRAK